jgi:molybdopterin molybdotransferase
MSLDVRMRGFQQRTEVGAVLRLIEDRIEPLGQELVDIRAAGGRVLASDITAEVAVPGFDRAAMDGYALRGVETFGADSYTTLEFAVIGESMPARPFRGKVASGQAVRIMTGAPMPEGADAVIQAEATTEVDSAAGKRIRITEAVPPGRHVGRRGEDIEGGTLLVPAGRVLRPQDLGLLASVGATPVAVIRQPRVAVLVTGDELLPCGAKPQGFQIVDSNSVMLAALATRDGAASVRIEMIPDSYELVRDALARAALQAASKDLVLVSGGSSVGVEDNAPRLVRELGELVVHGVALRPASPTGLGFVGSRPVFLLPGNPVSCLCAYDLFAGPALRRLGGKSLRLPYQSRELPLVRKIVSAVGRVDYVRVITHEGTVEPLAVSGASILSSTTRADGFVLVPGDLEGHAEGEIVRVYCYDHEARPIP